MNAMRWASKLPNDCSVLELVRSLPREVVQEQIRLWNARGTASSAPMQKIVVGAAPSLPVKKSEAKRFQHFCDALGLRPADRLPRFTMTRFMQDNMSLAKSLKQTGMNIATSRKRHHMPNVRRWHIDWQRECGLVDGETAVAAKSLLKSRAPLQACRRRRAAGGGRPHTNQAVRQELYEWFASIRHAIDWKLLITTNRGRGLKKNLARFPRSVLKVKVQQLLREHAHASLLNGVAVRVFKPDSQWFSRWQEDYGLSLRQANRKYAVPKHVLKERLELFWVSGPCARLRTHAAELGPDSIPPQREWITKQAHIGSARQHGPSG